MLKDIKHKEKEMNELMKVEKKMSNMKTKEIEKLKGTKDCYSNIKLYTQSPYFTCNLYYILYC